MKSKHYNLNGTITLFLCLIFLTMLSFIMIVLESCRIHLVKAHTEGISHIALESATGYFSLPLFENYGIFAINISDSSLTSLLEKYINDNFSPSAGLAGSWYNFSKINSYVCSPDKIYHITDEDGKIFADQIIRFMNYKAASDISDIIFQSSFIDTFSKNYIDISTIDIEKNMVDTSFPLSELSEDPVNETMLTEQEAVSKRNSIFNKIKKLLTKGTLDIYIDKSSDISARRTDMSALPSSICRYKKHIDFLSSTDKLMYLTYLSDTFKCYTDKKTDSSELNYQLEYLLNNDPCDENNLLQSIFKIQSLRTKLNLAYLYTDSEKRQLSKTLAVSAVGLIPVPFLVEFTQLAILSAWASAEAIVDVRDLLKGNEIPLFKSKQSWSLSLDDILTFDFHTKSKNQTAGFSYKQYLLLFLYIDFDTDTIYKTMDLIQMDLRKNYLSKFQMTECITGMKYNFSFEYPFAFFHKHSSSIFQHKFTQSYGY